MWFLGTVFVLHPPLGRDTFQPGAVGLEHHIAPFPSGFGSTMGLIDGDVVDTGVVVAVLVDNVGVVVDNGGVVVATVVVAIGNVLVATGIVVVATGGVVVAIDGVVVAVGGTGHLCFLQYFTPVALVAKGTNTKTSNNMYLFIVCIIQQTCVLAQVFPSIFCCMNLVFLRTLSLLFSLHTN